ncbi:hypothetical protein [Pseudoblastomonas halimionae]|uniref:Secreted protein n=1 Tax=Alteriqipengyuania halimionae TaxID=1926630 RepID=A0A6I4U667_9SPHN|nr:hypothetical protein [Alteriqipengyuania halimionae]MXP10894.1 hypothetical protein [Alteriqipengyuania halimionae]
MQKPTIVLAPAALAIGLAFASPAMAQDESTKINQVFITEDEECPQSTETTIVVCGRLEDPYRIPKELRGASGPQAEPFEERVRSYEIMTDTGIQSCSPVGAGGFTGCTQEMIRQAYGEKAVADSVRFAQLIEEARAERLSEIDEDAAETQRRVEELEAAYMRKLEAERRGEDPDAEPLPAPEGQGTPASDEAEDAEAPEA